MGGVASKSLRIHEVCGNVERRRGLRGEKCIEEAGGKLIFPLPTTSFPFAGIRKKGLWLLGQLNWIQLQQELAGEKCHVSHQGSLCPKYGREESGKQQALAVLQTTQSGQRDEDQITNTFHMCAHMSWSHNAMMGKDRILSQECQRSFN